MTGGQENKITSIVNMHSVKIRSKNSSAVIVKEKIQYEDGTIEPNIRTYYNPVRSFYITKPKYRRNRLKIEYELLDRLDRFTCYDHELLRKLAGALGMRVAGGWIDPNTLFKSPYVYGADIDIEALIKMRYLDTYKGATMAPSVGFLDIETSIDTDEIILISFIHGTTIHTAGLKAFCYDDIDGKRVPFTEEDAIKHANENLNDRVGDHKFTYDIKFFDTEIKLIAWIFSKIHQAKQDFIGVWNINFDIPRIISRIEKNNHRPIDIFHNPDVDRDLSYFKYREDKRPVSHFTLKWHWLFSSCGSQFVDSQGLYSQCRRTAGFRASYRLDAVLQDYLNLGKLPLHGGSHTIMQRHHFKDYIVYNIFDVVGLKLLEDMNGDMMAMTVLSGPSPVSTFATQTKRATNQLYWNLIGKDMVLASCSRDDAFIKLDKKFPNSGGSVLQPANVKGVGIDLDV